MAEKKVSVRLSATGGRQVRAELEGVGEAGTRGMGRLSRELDQANARMAAFARRAKIAATAAATALAGAVVAMTRSTVAAANEINQLSQVANANPELFQRWSAASATVGITGRGARHDRLCSCPAHAPGQARSSLRRAGVGVPRRPWDRFPTRTPGG